MVESPGLTRQAGAPVPRPPEANTRPKRWPSWIKGGHQSSNTVQIIKWSQTWVIINGFWFLFVFSCLNLWTSWLRTLSSVTWAWRCSHSRIISLMLFLYLEPLYPLKYWTWVTREENKLLTFPDYSVKFLISSGLLWGSNLGQTCNF